MKTVSYQPNAPSPFFGHVCNNSLICSFDAFVHTQDIRLSWETYSLFDIIKRICRKKPTLLMLQVGLYVTTSSNKCIILAQNAVTMPHAIRYLITKMKMPVQMQTDSEP